MGSMELFIFLLEKGPKIGDYQYEVPVEKTRSAGSPFMLVNEDEGHKADCTTIGCSFGMLASPVHQPASPLH